MDMARVLVVSSCLLALAVGVAPPAALPPVLPAALPNAAVVAQSPGTGFGTAGATATNAASAQPTPRLRGQPSVVQAHANTAEGAWMESLKGTLLTDSAAAPSIYHQVSQAPRSPMKIAIERSSSLDALMFAAVAGALVGGLSERQRKKSERQRKKFAVAAYASEPTAEARSEEASRSMGWPSFAAFAAGLGLMGFVATEPVLAEDVISAGVTSDAPGQPLVKASKNRRTRSGPLKDKPAAAQTTQAQGSTGSTDAEGKKEYGAYIENGKKKIFSPADDLDKDELPLGYPNPPLLFGITAIPVAIYLVFWVLGSLNVI